MLVLGIGNLAAVKPAWFVQLLEGPSSDRSWSFVRPAPSRPRNLTMAGVSASRACCRGSA